MSKSDINNVEASFYISQKDAKPNKDQKSPFIEAKVVGVTFGNRQDVIGKMNIGDMVFLVREPDNPYDPNAIRVETKLGLQIGFLSRQVANKLADTFDKHDKPVEGTVESIFGGEVEKGKYGVRIRFSIPITGALHNKLPSPKDLSEIL